MTSAAVRKVLPSWPVLVALGAALTSAALRPRLPGAQSYQQVPVPPWIVPVAVVLGAVVVLGEGALPRRVLLAAGGSACVLLLWGGAGLPLDGFRLFFRVTGIPAGDFAAVDWPGLAARGTATIAMALVLVATVRFRGVPAAARRTSWLGAVAVVSAVPYPALKLYWAGGGTVALPPGGSSHGALGEVAVFGVVAVVALALTGRWGRVLPRRVLSTAGWFVAAALVTQGVMPVFAVLAVPLGGPALPSAVAGGSGVLVGLVGLVYGTWVVLGVSVGAATLAYQDRTRPGRAVPARVG